MMKKKKIAIVIGAAVLALSACGQTGEPQKVQTNAADDPAEMSDDENQSLEIQDDETPDSADRDPAEAEEEGHSAILADDVLESLTGEYDYSSEDGIGRLTIKKTSDGYDISDYESEDSYRFLADSSYIENIEANRIYMKYPEQIYSDGTAVFSYYILEYDTDRIDVYYGKSSFEEAAFLYHAVKGTETLADADEYEGEYLDYAVDEPGLEIKKNSDGTYRIQILIYRLCFIDDGIGQKTENGLEFTATGPDGNEVHGVIKLEEDIAAVTISGEVWLEFAGTNEFAFYKTSNVPNMYDAAADSDVTAEELLDLFISGSINAVDPEDLTSTFYITDLNMDTEEWDSYSIGEKVDLDNDGEDELVLNGPYGGIYLDARDDKVYVLAAGEGTALILSYTYYNGDIWIMYSNRSSAGFEAYHMEKFEGADHPAAEMNFGEELVDSDDPESETKYTLNGTEISYDEYYALCSKIFAAEVSTES